MVHVYTHTKTTINATFDFKLHFAYLFLGFRINNNLNQIHTIFTNCSILLSCVNKSFCLGMKVIFPIEPSNDLVITILNSRTHDNYYWIFVPQLHATGDIINLNGAVSMVLYQLHVMSKYQIIISSSRSYISDSWLFCFCSPQIVS